MIESTCSLGVAVVGGGLAGWTAAVRAQELGRDVALIERSTRRSGWGNAVISGGILHAAFRDPRSAPQELLEAIVDLTGGHTDRAVATAWAHNAAPTISWIESHGGKLMTDPADEIRARVFSPVREPVPGLTHVGFGAEAFLLGLHHRFVAAGGLVIQPARARQLRKSANGGPQRWEVEIETAEGLRIIESSSVILADGGFQANPALLREYLGTDKVKLRATNTGTGDGLLMGLSVGAKAINMDLLYGHLLAREALENDDLWPYPMLDGLAAFGMVVDSRGMRFCDEGISGVSTFNNMAHSKEPLDNWIVIDDMVWEGVGQSGVTPPNPHIKHYGGTVLTAPTLGELADRMGVPRSGLEQSSSDLSGSRKGVSPARTGSVRLEKPPFHAIPIVAGLTFTMGGLLVDECGRILNQSHDPIAGLYAAGGTMGGLHGGPNAGYGGGLLEAAIFGLLAGGDAK